MKNISIYWDTHCDNDNCQVCGGKAFDFWARVEDETGDWDDENDDDTSHTYYRADDLVDFVEKKQKELGIKKIYALGGGEGSRQWAIAWKNRKK